jgi:glycosyltransferase involved in cell wall biosynthesis
LKILLIHRWFWPDSPPYASMLRSIGAHLAADGHEVTVLTAQPSYTKATAERKMPRHQELDGFHVKRVRLLPESKRNYAVRALNMLFFMCAIASHILFRRKNNRYDLAMASTMPPVLVAAAARKCVHLRGGKFFYHMMDIYPEIALTSGMAKKGFLTNSLARIDRNNCAKAERVIVLSSDMRDAVVARGIPTTNVEVLNNFQLQSFDGEGCMPEGLEKPEGSFRILFAGNLGRFQGLETMLEAMALLEDLPAVRFDLLGDGVGREGLEKLAGSRLDRSIFFHGYHPIENTMHVIKTCDLGLIALNPDIYRHAYPSKTMTYLGVGAPILLVIEAESELAQMVARERIGYHVAQNNPEALAAVIRQAYIERAELDGMRMRSKALAERSFTAEAVLPRWSELVKL